MFFFVFILHDLRCPRSKLSQIMIVLIVFLHCKPILIIALISPYMIIDKLNIYHVPVSHNIIPDLRRIRNDIRAPAGPLLGHAIGRFKRVKIEVIGGHELNELLQLGQFLEAL